jgi:hypothetical protein
MDPETLDTQLLLDEAFDDVVVLEIPPANEDWMAGEFDIT